MSRDRFSRSSGANRWTCWQVACQAADPAGLPHGFDSPSRLGRHVVEVGLALGGRKSCSSAAPGLPLVRAFTDLGACHRLRDARLTGALLLGLHDPLQDPAPGRARECGPGLACRRFDQVLDRVEQRPTIRRRARPALLRHRPVSSGLPPRGGPPAPCWAVTNPTRPCAASSAAPSERHQPSAGGCRPRRHRRPPPRARSKSRPAGRCPCATSRPSTADSRRRSAEPGSPLLTAGDLDVLPLHCRDLSHRRHPGPCRTTRWVQTPASVGWAGHAASRSTGRASVRGRRGTGPVDDFKTVMDRMSEYCCDHVRCVCAIPGDGGHNGSACWVTGSPGRG